MKVLAQNLHPAREERVQVPSLQVVDPRKIPGWDELVQHHEAHGIFHSAAWCSVLSDTYGFTPLYLAAWDGQRFRAMLPLLEVNSWLTGRRGVSLPFTDTCDPLLSPEEDEGEILQAAQALGMQRLWKSMELRGSKLSAPGAAPSVSFYTHSLSLQQSAADLFAGFDPGVRRAIRKAEQGGVSISVSQSVEAIKSYYQLHCLTRKRHGLPPQPLAFFLSVWRHIIRAGHGFVLLAEAAGKTVAGAVFFQFGTRAVYKFGASNTAAQNLRPNNLLMWHAIQRLRQAGMESLDFGRTSFTQEGLRRFKLGWGASEQVVSYRNFDFRSRSYVRQEDSAHGRHNVIFRALPVWLSKQIGSFLYRHIA